MNPKPFPRQLNDVISSSSPNKGELENLKISRTYFEALQSGAIPSVSKGLAHRLSEVYDIPEQQFNSLIAYGDFPYKVFHDPDQNLFFTMEQGSRFSPSLNNSIRQQMNVFTNSTKSLERLSDDGQQYIDKKMMVDLLNNNPSSFEVPGAMPLLLRNIAAYFAKSPEAHGLTDNEDEFIIWSKDGYVHDKSDFMTVSDSGAGGRNGNKEFSVNENFFSGFFERIYTDRALWRRYYERGSVSEQYNTVRFKLTYNIAERLKKSIAFDIRNDTLFSTVEEGEHDWLLQNVYSGAFPRDGEPSFYSGERPILTLDNDSRELGVRFYPFQLSSQPVAPTLDTPAPTIEQQLLFKRMYYRMTHPVSSTYNGFFQR